MQKRNMIYVLLGFVFLFGLAIATHWDSEIALSQWGIGPEINYSLISTEKNIDNFDNTKISSNRNWLHSFFDNTYCLLSGCIVTRDTIQMDCSCDGTKEEVK